MILHLHNYGSKEPIWLNSDHVISIRHLAEGSRIELSRRMDSISIHETPNEILAQYPAC